jgi:hypothetical protein
VAPPRREPQEPLNYFSLDICRRPARIRVGPISRTWVGARWFGCGEPVLRRSTSMMHVSTVDFRPQNARPNAKETPVTAQPLRRWTPPQRHLPSRGSETSNRQARSRNPQSNRRLSPSTAPRARSASRVSALRSEARGGHVGRPSGSLQRGSVPGAPGRDDRRDGGLVSTLRSV